MKEKDFDCVELKRRIQAEIYEQIKHLSDAQRQAWTRNRIAAGPSGEQWKAVWAASDARAEEARRRRGA